MERYRLQNGAWVLGTDSPRKTLLRMLDFNVADGVAERISCPTLVCSGASDLLNPGLSLPTRRERVLRSAPEGNAHPIRLTTENHRQTLSAAEADIRRSTGCINIRSGPTVRRTG